MAEPGLSLTLFWPFFVLLLCAGVLLLWRWQRHRAFLEKPGPLRLAGRIDLSPQHILYIVEAGNRQLLLGGAPGGLSLLADWPASEGVPPNSAAGLSGAGLELKSETKISSKAEARPELAA